MLGKKCTQHYVSLKRTSYYDCFCHKRNLLIQSWQLIKQNITKCYCQSSVQYKTKSQLPIYIDFVFMLTLPCLIHSLEKFTHYSLLITHYSLHSYNFLALECRGSVAEEDTHFLLDHLLWHFLYKCHKRRIPCHRRRYPSPFGQEAVYK